MTKIKPEERRGNSWDKINKRSREDRKGNKWIKGREGLERQSNQGEEFHKDNILNEGILWGKEQIDKGKVSHSL